MEKQNEKTPGFIFFGRLAAAVSIARHSRRRAERKERRRDIAKVKLGIDLMMKENKQRHTFRVLPKNFLFVLVLGYSVRCASVKGLESLFPAMLWTSDALLVASSITALKAPGPRPPPRALSSRLRLTLEVIEA